MKAKVLLITPPYHCGVVESSIFPVPGVMGMLVCKM